MIYNGVTFDDFSVIEYVRRKLLPPRTVNTRNTGGVNSYFVQVTHDVSSIEVDVRVIGKTRTEVLDIYNIMASTLAVNKPMPLYLRDQPGKYNLGILNGGPELHNFLETGFVTLTFDCPDPYLYSEEITKFNDINGVSCLNRGGAPSNGLITIKIPSARASVKVTMPSTMETITITHPFVANDILTIDLESEDVWKNTTTYIPSDLSSTFFQIPPGFFIITTDAGELELVYRERWF